MDVRTVLHQKYLYKKCIQLRVRHTERHIERSPDPWVTSVLSPVAKARLGLKAAGENAVQMSCVGGCPGPCP